MKILLGPDGRPVRRRDLEEELSGPTVSGVRSPHAEWVSVGLTPLRLGRILQQADQGDARAYLALAAEIEEKDLHYGGVLQVRKLQVSQLPITVEAASDARDDIAAADLVRDWLDCDDVTDELFDLLDAVGKGIAIAEIVWQEAAGGRIWPELRWREPTWFQFDPVDLSTPLLINGAGQPEPLAPWRYVVHRGRFKTGIPVRAGLARAAVWAWCFKSFTLRDWLALLEVYGIPLRLGRYDSAATPEDRATLLRAVRSIASDAAAIIPRTMDVEFISGDTKSDGALFRSHADYWDQQVSKLVLGQVGTTDAIAGGHAVGKVHDQVRADIERADARALAGSLNRDLVPVLVSYNMRPMAAYPRLRIGRPEEVDHQALAGVLGALVPFGLRVTMSEVRDKLGFKDPDPDEEVLMAPGAGSPAPSPQPPTDARALAAADPTADDRDEVDDQVDILAAAAAPVLDDLIAQARRMLGAGATLEEARGRLLDLHREMDASPLAGLLEEALIAADIAGRAEVFREDFLPDDWPKKKARRPPPPG